MNGRHRDNSLLRLMTLGGLSLESPPGTAAPSTTKTRLALLAALAVSGNRGISREKLISLLWSEADDERGRSSLRQALYSLRRELGGDPVQGTSNLSLNWSLISADASEFSAALAAGDLATAVELYKGPYLDGVHLRASAEFERWADEQRAHLASAYEAALEKLAVAASANNDFQAAVRWWRLRSLLDPFSSRIATSLMSSLAASGDREAGIRYAEMFVKTAEEELGSGSGADVKAALRRLRNSSAFLVHGSEQATDQPPARDQQIDSSWTEPPKINEQSQLGPSAPIGVLAQKSVSRRSKRTALASGSAAALIVIAGFTYYTKQPAPEGRQVETTRGAVVLPFCAEGGPEVADAARQIPDVISASLPSESDFHVIAVTLTSCVGNHSRARDVAQKLGATRLASGQITARRGRVLLSATVQLRSAGEWRSTPLTIEGGQDSVAALSALLAHQITGSLLGEDSERISRFKGRSAATLQFYLAGRALYRDGRYPEAVASFWRAIDTDSTFALAALGIAEAGGWLWPAGAERKRRGLFTTWALRNQLSTPDRAVFEALVGPPDKFRNDGEHYTGWELATEKAPRSPTAWYELGDRLYHIGAVVGIDDQFSKAKAAFERSLEIDPEFRPSLMHLLQLAINRSDWNEVSRIQKLLFTAGKDADVLPFIRWRIAAARDARLVDSLRRNFHNTPARSLMRIAGYSQIDAINIQSGQEAAHELLRKAATSDETLLALLMLHDMAINRGRYSEASAYVERINALGPIRPGIAWNVVDGDALWITDAVIARGDTASAAAAAQRIERRTRAPARTGTERFREVGDLCALGLWRGRESSARPMRDIPSRLRTWKAQPDSARFFGASGELCALMLEATQLVNVRSSDAPAKVAALDSLARLGPPEYGVGLVNVILARLWAKLGDNRAALAASRRRLYDWSTGARYFIAYVEEEADLAHAIGDRVGETNARATILEVKGPFSH